MGVLDGQAVSAGVTNPAFLDANADDTGVGIITLANNDPGTGAAVDNLQREHNSAASFMGKGLNSDFDDVPGYGNNQVGTPNQPLFDRIDALSQRFDNASGHSHNGGLGEGQRITASNLDAVPFRGFFIQGTRLTSVSGSSTTVTTQLSGKTPGGGIGVEGVVTSTPYNRVIIRQGSGANEGDAFVDAFGNVVYGRVTYAATVWTLSYYVMIGATETAYTFSGFPNVDWYYQEIYNPMVSPPVFSELAIIPSDNPTADVQTATTTLQGKVSLAITAQDVGSSTSAGTANAVVANADHTHRGVASVAKSGSSALYADVTLTGSGGTSLTQALQNIDISSPALSTNAAQSVGASNSAGSGTASSKDDHTHQGVHSVSKSGSAQLFSDVTLTGTGGTSLTQTLQNIDVSSPALSSTAPADIASSAVTGTGTTTARADHVHRGVFSVHKNGSAQLFGEITLSQGTNITITQSGNDLSIAATGGGGGGGSLAWVEDVNSPIAAIENQNQVYLYSNALGQQLYALIRVPNGYTAGSQVRLRTTFYSAGTSNTVLMRTQSTLIRTGTDAITSTTNQRTSTNTAVTLTAGTVNIPQALVLDLTDASGQINAVAIAAGDLIKIRLYRDTDTSTVDVSLPVYGAEVTFT